MRVTVPNGTTARSAPHLSPSQMLGCRPGFLPPGRVRVCRVNPIDPINSQLILAYAHPQRGEGGGPKGVSIDRLSGVGASAGVCLLP